MVFLLVGFMGTGICRARLGDTEAQSEARYGPPVTSLENEFAPLLKGASNRTYQFEGWKIRSAFLEERCVCIEYSKRLGQNQSMLITDIEQKAILDSEQGDGTWRRQSRRFSDYTATQLDRTGSGRTRYDVWINTNGARASFRLGKSILRLEMREVLEQELDPNAASEKESSGKEDKPALPEF